MKEKKSPAPDNKYVELLEKKIAVYEKLFKNINKSTDWVDLANSTILVESARWSNSSMFAAGATWAQRRLKELNGGVTP